MERISLTFSTIEEIFFIEMTFIARLLDVHEFTTPKGEGDPGRSRNILTEVE